MSLKNKVLKQKNLWHVGAIAGFLLVACVYFYPALQGYSVDSHDVGKWVGVSQEIKDYRVTDGEQIQWTNSIFSGMPATQISMAWEGRQIIDIFRKIYTFGMPQPISYLFLYFVSFYIMAMAFKLKPIVGILGSLAYGFSSYFIVIIEAGHNTKAGALGYAPLLIAGLIMAYRWKNWILGVAFSSLFMAWELIQNHLQITYYFAFIMVALGIVELVRYYKAGQIKKFAKITGFLIAGYLVAVLMNIGNIRMTQEYAEYTMRGGSDLTAVVDSTQQNQQQETTDGQGGLSVDYITHWSYGKAETFTLLVPNYKGGKSIPMGMNDDNKDHLDKADGKYKGNIRNFQQYWGDQPITSGPVYVGAIVFFLAFLSFFYIKDKARWALLVVTVLAILLSWGKNFLGFTEAFINMFPLYDKFRTVTMILVIVELSLPLLAIMFLHRLFKHREEIAKNIKPFLYVTGGFLLLLLGMVAMPGVFNTFISAQEQEYFDSFTDPNAAAGIEEFIAELELVRMSIFRADVWRSFFLVLLGAGAVYAYIRNVFNYTVLVAAIGVLTLFDLVSVDKRYLGTEKKGQGFAQWKETYKKDFPYLAGDAENDIYTYETMENPAIAASCDSAVNVMKESLPDDIKGSERQRKLDWARFRQLNRLTNYRVFDQTGGYTASGYAPYFHKAIGGYHGAKLSRYDDLIRRQLGTGNQQVFNMLNTKYVIATQKDANGKEIVNSKLVQRNPGALGAAWFVKELFVVPDADAEMAGLNQYSSYGLERHSITPVMIDGQEIAVDQPVKLSGAEKVEFVDVRITMDGNFGMSLDTIEIPLPLQVSETDVITLVKFDTLGLQWLQSQFVDSTMNRIFTFQKTETTGFKAASQAVVNQEFASNFSKTEYSGDGTIEMVSYHPDKIVYKTSSTTEQLAVFSEIYYPAGWTANIDGNEATISRADFVLRCMEIPAGDHTVTFEYHSDTYESSGMMAWAGSFVILLGLGYGFFVESKREEEDEEEEDTAESTQEESDEEEESSEEA